MPFCITLGGFKKSLHGSGKPCRGWNCLCRLCSSKCVWSERLRAFNTVPFACHLLHSVYRPVYIYIYMYVYLYIYIQTRHPRGFLWLVARDYCLLSRVSEVMAQAVSFTDTNPVLGRVSGDIMVTRVSG